MSTMVQFNPATVEELLNEAGFRVVEQEIIEPRPASKLPVPQNLHPAVREILCAWYPDGLYSHQAQGLEDALRGQSLCLSTATASGKSLVFMAAAADRALRDPETATVAFYPARALIQDQILKWRELLQPLGISFGYIDGGVPSAERSRILRENRIVLMTPDVAQAWLMAGASAPGISSYLRCLGTVILDEAHVYDGVFGTNMAYLMRRLKAISGLRQCICSTATIGAPDKFVETLTGFPVKVLGPDADGSPTPPKTLLLAERGKVRRKGAKRASGIGTTGPSSTFEMVARFLAACSDTGEGRFLAFGDSRRMVEHFVAALHRKADSKEVSELEEGEEPEEESELDLAGDRVLPRRVLPYRSGYEDEDRKAIQRALTRGSLRGVVSTSALELGLDIGEIDLVVLLSPPPSVKAFWQRLGRGGRRKAGVCVVLDSEGFLRQKGGLARYLQREMEPNRLYLDNKYLQYANALCAAAELSQRNVNADVATRLFESLPEQFRRFLANEIDPREAVPPDLYPLKQRGQAAPHLEFPLRTGIEREFRIFGWGQAPLGSVTFSQALREAYPGAIYYYMARPYRVHHFHFARGEIQARRAKRYFTNPILQRMTFPRFEGGLLRLWVAERGFVAEAEMQVSERVVGFIEIRGNVREKHEYGPTSPYAQRPLNRFFETTGVAWWFGEDVRLAEATGELILRAFCLECGVQERDLGLGTFFTRSAPAAVGECQGWCVYDATYGSLRLTEALAARFPAVAELALDMGRAEGADQAIIRQLRQLRRLAEGLEERPVQMAATALPTSEGDWAVLIARGQKAMLMKEAATEEVTVVDHRYTPRGVLYTLRHPDPGVKWQVEASRVTPIYGETKMVRVNLVTGEEEPL